MPHKTRGIYILPNLFTTGNLFCGYYAIVKILHSFQGDTTQYSKAGVLVLLATIFDGLDGRVARLTDTTSRFGMEYDSLADLISFCLAPAMLLYAFGLADFGRLGWLAAFLFFSCGALRLARFNSREVTTQEHDSFVGLPTPAAALLMTTIVLLHRDLDTDPSPARFYLVLVVYLLALLMVSNVRFRAWKQIDLRKPRSFSVLVGTLTAFVILVAHPILSVFILTLAYVSLGVIENFLPTFWRLKFLTWFGIKESSRDENSQYI